MELSDGEYAIIVKYHQKQIKELVTQLIEAREAAIDLYHIHAFSDKRAAEVYIRVKKLIRKWEEDAESKSF